VGAPASKPLPWIVGRYAIYSEIAAGGMATVHLGRLVGPAGFARTVAVKRLHPQYAKDPQFVAMFLDEARLAARVQHPNVVSTLDVVATEGELFVVMDYIRGEALARLVRGAKAEEAPIPLPIVSAVVAGALHGLHAAHETKDERGQPLGIVHRDVSPQNILVGVDGVPRVLDFGVAKAAGRVQTTSEGQLKGKLAYMAPEQMQQTTLDRTADIYAMAVVLWESIVLKRLFKGDSEAHVFAMVLGGQVHPPSKFRSGVSRELDAVVLRALARDRNARFPTAEEMALALERVVRPATASEVAAWVQMLAAEPLRKRSKQIEEIESLSGVGSGGVEMQAKQFLAAFSSGPSLSTNAEDGAGAANSQASSISVSSSAKDPPPRRAAPQRGALLLLAGVLLASGLGFALKTTMFSSASLPNAPADNGAPSNSAWPPPPWASATTAPPASSPVGAPEPEAPPTTSASSAAAHPVPSASGTVAPSRATRRAWGTAKPPPPAPTTTAHDPMPAPTPNPPPPPTAKKDCDPPYTIDSSGQKHYKPDCF
jgi:serine/threonine protein kinase